MGEKAKSSWISDAHIDTFVISDSYLVLLASALVHCRHIENAIGINVKGHFNLWHTSGGRGNSCQLKFA